MDCSNQARSHLINYVLARGSGASGQDALTCYSPWSSHSLQRGRLLLGGRRARVALWTAVGTELGALSPGRGGREALDLALQRRCGLVFRSLGHDC
jgi:hypothetical protein